MRMGLRCLGNGDLGVEKRVEHGAGSCRGEVRKEGIWDIRSFRMREELQGGIEQGT